MKTRKQVIDEAYDALHAAYSKAFGDWWLNSTAQTSNWGFNFATYEGEEFIKTTVAGRGRGLRPFWARLRYLHRIHRRSELYGSY